MTVTHENGISYDIENDSFQYRVTVFDFAKYLKGRYRNVERFRANFLNFFQEAAVAYDRPDRVGNLEMLATLVDKATEFTYEEAFKIDDDTFRALVFGSINIPEMIKHLGAKRIKSEGQPLKQRVYKLDGSYTVEDYTVVYELYEVDCKKLNINNNQFVVKCWCTSTNEEHWLWTKPEFAANGPLEAIASTCLVYENMLGHITTIKRQGDVFLFEMDKEITPHGKLVHLTAKQYFDLLVSQT